MIAAPFIAVDWGTTNRRSLTIVDGAVVLRTLGDGACSTSDWSGEVAAIRTAHGDHPMLLSGMVGSSIGWRSVPYVPAPAALADLAAAVTRIDPRTAIVPGVCVRRGTGGDVMRGEELLLLGAVTAGLAPADAVLCQPGTHCKWTRMRGGRIVDFVTAMTGELFALLRSHSLLSTQLAGPVADGDAFRAGVRKGSDGDLAADLFGVRAAALLGLRQDADAAAYASGLLIGADVAARRDWLGTAPVIIVADDTLGPLYAAAVATLGGTGNIISDEAAYVAGADALWKLLP